MTGPNHQRLCTNEDLHVAAFYAQRHPTADGLTWHRPLGHPSSRVLQYPRYHHFIKLNKKVGISWRYLDRGEEVGGGLRFARGESGQC